jgi:hypothetical protein
VQPFLFGRHLAFPGLAQSSIARNSEPNIGTLLAGQGPPVWREKNPLVASPREPLSWGYRPLRLSGRGIKNSHRRRWTVVAYYLWLDLSIYDLQCGCNCANPGCPPGRCSRCRMPAGQPASAMTLAALMSQKGDSALRRVSKVGPCHADAAVVPGRRWRHGAARASAGQNRTRETSPIVPERGYERRPVSRRVLLGAGRVLLTGPSRRPPTDEANGRRRT